MNVNQPALPPLRPAPPSTANSPPVAICTSSQLSQIAFQSIQVLSDRTAVCTGGMADELDVDRLQGELRALEGERQQLNERLVGHIAGRGGQHHRDRLRPPQASHEPTCVASQRPGRHLGTCASSCIARHSAQPPVQPPPPPPPPPPLLPADPPACLPRHWALTHPGS